jgi:Nucleotidyltransferase
MQPNAPKREGPQAAKSEQAEASRNVLLIGPGLKSEELRYEPLATLDADIALPARLKVRGDEIYQRLASNGFETEFVGHHKPPAAHYRLTDPGIEFYAEFVESLAGSAVSRTGKAKATHRVGGSSSQNLRYVEILLARPWSVTLFANNGFPLANEAEVQIANRVSFLAQKILTHGRRNRQDRAKDILFGIWSSHRSDSCRIENRAGQGVTSRSDSRDLQFGIYSGFRRKRR